LSIQAQTDTFTGHQTHSITMAGGRRDPHKDPCIDTYRKKDPKPPKPKPKKPDQSDPWPLPYVPHRPHIPHQPHQPYYPPYNPPAPPPRPGCRNGDPSCGQGYKCNSCYNSAVQPMGYAGVNRNAPVANNYPGYYCQPRRC